VHNIRIPNTGYSASKKSKLLSSQHWSEEAKDRYPIKNGTWCATLDDHIILFWDQQKYQKTALLTPGSNNVGVICSAGGVKHYEKAYQSNTKRIGECMVAMPTILDVEEHHTTD
jgi:hypothetical protein